MNAELKAQLAQTDAKVLLLEGRVAQVTALEGRVAQLEALITQFMPEFSVRPRNIFSSLPFSLSNQNSQFSR